MLVKFVGGVSNSCHNIINLPVKKIFERFPVQNILRYCPNEAKQCLVEHECLCLLCSLCNTLL